MTAGEMDFHHLFEMTCLWFLFVQQDGVMFSRSLILIPVCYLDESNNNEYRCSVHLCVCVCLCLSGSLCVCVCVCVEVWGILGMGIYCDN